MIKGFITAWVAVLSISHGLAQTTIPKDVEVALIRQQRQIVSALSGASEIEGNEILKRRWTKKEKFLTRSYLSSKLSDIGLTAQEQKYKMNLAHKKPSLNPFEGTNLFAILPATERSEEYIIIGAHYDSVEKSSGAMDNATGYALAYGVTQLMTAKKIQKKPCC